MMSHDARKKQTFWEEPLYLRSVKVDPPPPRLSTHVARRALQGMLALRELIATGSAHQLAEAPPLCILQACAARPGTGGGAVEAQHGGTR